MQYFEYDHHLQEEVMCWSPEKRKPKRKKRRKIVGRAKLRSQILGSSSVVVATLSGAGSKDLIDAVCWDPTRGMIPNLMLSLLMRPAKRLNQSLSSRSNTTRQPTHSLATQSILLYWHSPAPLQTAPHCLKGYNHWISQPYFSTISIVCTKILLLFHHNSSMKGNSSRLISSKFARSHHGLVHAFLQSVSGI